MIDPKNRESLEDISRSLVCLSLHNYTLPSVPSHDPLVLPPVDAQMRSTQAGLNGDHNRWLDKATSIVVETNGRGGLAGEHSPIDAVIPNTLMDFVTAVPVDKSAFGEEIASDKGWRRIDFVGDEALKREIAACEARNKAVIADSEPSELWYAEYGVEWIKKEGECGLSTV